MAGICLGAWTASLGTLAAVGCGSDDPKGVPAPEQAGDAGAHSAAGGEATNGGIGATNGGSGSGGEQPTNTGGADGNSAGSGMGGDQDGTAGDGAAGDGPGPVTELEPASGWKPLTNQITPGTADAHAPRVAFDLRGNGVAFAVWTTTGAGGDDVYVSRYQGTWSAPLLLTPGSAVGEDPQITADAKGNAAAIWRQPEDDVHTIFTARYSATTSSWAAPQPMQMAPGIDVEAPAISAEDDSYVVATWRVVDRENGQITSANVAAADLDGSIELATWQLRAPLDVGTSVLTGLPRLALNDVGNGFVVWDHNEGDKRAIYAARYMRGIGFEPALKLGFSDFDADSPDVAVNDNGDAVVVWRQRGADGSWGVSINRFAAIANAWAPVNSALAEHAPGAGQPRVASNVHGAFACAWWQLQNGKRSLFGTRGLMKANGEGSWTTGSLIETDDRGDVDEPTLAVREDGTALVAWAQSRGSYDQIVLASSINSGWQLGTLQQDITRNASTPFVGVVPGSNQALVLWTELTGPAPGLSTILGASFTAQ